MSTALWQLPAPVEPAIKKEDQVMEITPEEAEKAAAETRALLKFRGYCYWKCRIYGGETILIFMDGKEDALPPDNRYPAYSMRELDLLEELPDKTCRMVHQAKKAAGAVIVSVTDSSLGGEEP